MKSVIILIVSVVVLTLNGIDCNGRQQQQQQTDAPDEASRDSLNEDQSQILDQISQKIASSLSSGSGKYLTSVGGAKAGANLADKLIDTRRRDTLLNRNLFKRKHIPFKWGKRSSASVLASSERDIYESISNLIDYCAEYFSKPIGAPQQPKYQKFGQLNAINNLCFDLVNARPDLTPSNEPIVVETVDTGSDDAGEYDDYVNLPETVLQKRARNQASPKMQSYKRTNVPFRWG